MWPVHPELHASPERQVVPASHCYTLAHHNLSNLSQRTLSVTSFFEGQRVPLPVNFDEEFLSPFWFLIP